MQLLATPIGVVVAGLIAFLWVSSTPLGELKVTVHSSSLAVFLLTLAGVVVGVFVAHELIHAVTHPLAGCSPHSVLGFWP